MNSEAIELIHGILAEYLTLFAQLDARVKQLEERVTFLEPYREE